MSGDVIKDMREKAHAIALERRKAWWDGMTPAEQRRASASIREAELDEHSHLEEFKPGVIALEEGAPASPYLVQEQLMLIGCFVSLDDLCDRDYNDRRAASHWAATVMLEASDNDVIIAPRPEWLPGRDSANVDDLVQADRARFAKDPETGEDRARRLFDTEWPKPGVQPGEEPGYEIVDATREQAAMLDILEHVEEIRSILRITLGLDPEPQDPETSTSPGNVQKGATDGNDSTS